MITEPNATALLVSVFGLLLVVSVLSSRASERTGVPAVLLFLAVGMLAGSSGLLGIEFADYALAFRVGTIALVLILFDAGLNTPYGHVRPVWRQATMLATLGVLVTAFIVALGGWVMGLSWDIALLMGAIVSSTDAAATFTIVRSSGLALEKRVAATIELESGLNDPLAVLLTLALTAGLAVGGEEVSWLLLGADTLLELLIGVALGWLLGRVGGALMLRTTLQATGLYPVLTLALALLTYGIATMLHGSGFLAAYVAALVVGNIGLPYKNSLSRVHDAMAWLSQIGMFLLLGLLVFPDRLLEVAPMGLGVALLLAFVARPVAVMLSLAPFTIPWRQKVFIGWAGLRGAVPIILATFPVLSGVPGAQDLFDLVFFVVLVSALLTGGTVPWVMRRLDLVSDEPPAPSAVLEIVSTKKLSGVLLSYYVDEGLDVTGVPLSDLPFPPGTAVTLILRNDTILVPRGTSTLEVGDHVYIASEAADRPFIRLLFGREETA